MSIQDPSAEKENIPPSSEYFQYTASLSERSFQTPVASASTRGSADFRSSPATSKHRSRFPKKAACKQLFKSKIERTL